MNAAQLRATRARIDATIASLEAQLAQLQADRQSVNEQLAAVVYPIKTIPRELTSEIFLWYGCEEVSEQAGSPFVLASVCSLWREEALRTPGLWNHFRSMRNTNPERVADRLETYISRSGALPLDIYIYDLGHEKIFRLLADCSARWRCLAVAVDIASRLSSGSMADVRGPFPHLKYLALTFDADTPNPLPNLLDAPNLVHVDVMPLGESKDSWCLYIPWGQLTTLDVCMIDVLQCLELINLTPRLEQLRLFSDDGRDVPTNYPSRVLPHLHTLHIGYSSSHELLPHLILPKLRELESVDLWIASWRSYIQELIVRSVCILEKLEFFLTDRTFTDLEDVHAVTQLFRAIPTVEHLTIKCPRLSTSGFTRLFNTFAEDPPVLPALESLEVKCCDTRMELTPLVQMLTSRRQAQKEEPQHVVDLASFKLRFTQVEDPFGDDEEPYDGVDMFQQSTEMEGELQLLRKLHNEGLKIEIDSDFIWFDQFIDAKIIAELR
ncbi:hypothetical protein FB45DRAFT_805728 [Roridomyces roridus]|uniref:F-box domain-containing protein n=1 Tax=Roridomyces roridus TaxID=1738132 RepID=A0AAD7B411_9AGAR|nr:hypothetical protein FB45DRAFT_805728 [Roridomyces roridus]